MNKVHEQSNRPVDWVEKLVKQHTGRLYRVALTMLGRPADAEDIVQDVFCKLYEKQPQFETAEHETAWLIRVAVNLCKDRLRSHWWKTTVPLLDTYPAETDEQQHVMETVLKLPPKYRIAIHLFYYEGYETKEIARLTNQTEAAVRQQLTRARRMLRDFLKGECI